MISKNQQATKNSITKKTNTKPKIKTFGATKARNKQSSNNSTPSSWKNVFESKLTDDINDGMQKFMKGTNSSFSGTHNSENNSANITKNMILKLSHNLRENFEQNVELGQETLKCKTMSDVVDFQRKSFEVNYKNMVKIYSDFVHDVQNLATQSLKTSV